MPVLFFYRLLKIDYTDRDAKNSLIFLLLFPTAFFFGSVYSESLFLLFLVLSLYFARKRKWLIASVYGLLLSITRFMGIFILPALVFEYYSQNKFKNLKKSILNVSYICLITPLGLILYAYFNLIKWGDILYFIHVHGQLANSRSVDRIILFPQTILRYYKILSSISLAQYEWWIAFLELITFIFVGWLLYKAWKLKIRKSYLVFSILAFLLPVSSGTFSGLPRYVLILFPIFISLVLVKGGAFRFIFIVIALFLQFILLMFFSRGYFVA